MRDAAARVVASVASTASVMPRDPWEASANLHRERGCGEAWHGGMGDKSKQTHY